jgi:hypothetical protein
MSEESVRNLFDQWERVWHEAVTHTSRLKETTGITAAAA